MQLLSKVILTIAIGITAILTQACKDYDDDIENLDVSTTQHQLAIVTVVPNGYDGFIMKLTGTHVLVPTNMSSSPFGNKEVRAVAEMMVGQKLNDNKDQSMTKQSVTVIDIDSIQTKPTVPNLLTDNDAVYGRDPVEISNDWITSGDDGYLTLHLFAPTYGSTSAKHEFHLIRGINPENPLEFELRHNANGDIGGQIRGEALVAFNLNNLVESNAENRTKIRINWLSQNGYQSAEMYLTLRPKD